MTKAVDVRITGRVQGVSFRYYTEQRARALDVAGWVRNESDGAVAGHFEGPDHAVDALVAWCREGPRLARVEEVAVSGVEVTGTTEFVVRDV